MICFISGGITNVPDYMEKFEQAEQELKSLGFIPLNPAKMTFPLVQAGVVLSDDSWLEICFAALKQCDALYHLTNWMDSSGAAKEHSFATAYDIPIFYQANLELYQASNLSAKALVHQQRLKSLLPPLS